MLFHGGEWEIEVEGGEGSEYVRVRIEHGLRPLPLVGAAMGFLGLTDGTGLYRQEVRAEMSPHDDWLVGSEFGVIRLMVEQMGRKGVKKGRGCRRDKGVLERKRDKTVSDRMVSGRIGVYDARGRLRDSGGLLARVFLRVVHAQLFKSGRGSGGCRRCRPCGGKRSGRVRYSRTCG
ncbi:MAG: hypothetical protein ACLT98_05720 [Eggerthellaceae bacterium]